MRLLGLLLGRLLKLLSTPFGRADAADRTFIAHFNHTRRNQGKNHSSIARMLPANDREIFSMADENV
jgi:hypothetical protein